MVAFGTQRHMEVSIFLRPPLHLPYCFCRPPQPLAARIQEQAGNQGLQGARGVLPGIDWGPRSNPRTKLHQEGTGGVASFAASFWYICCECWYGQWQRMEKVPEQRCKHPNYPPNDDNSRVIVVLPPCLGSASRPPVPSPMFLRRQQQGSHHRCGRGEKGIDSGFFGFFFVILRWRDSRLAVLAREAALGGALHILARVKPVGVMRVQSVSLCCCLSHDVLSSYLLCSSVPGGGAGVSGARHGGGVEDRRRELPRFHRRGRQR